MRPRAFQEQRPVLRHAAQAAGQRGPPAVLPEARLPPQPVQAVLQPGPPIPVPQLRLQGRQDVRQQLREGHLPAQQPCQGAGLVAQLRGKGALVAVQPHAHEGPCGP